MQTDDDAFYALRDINAIVCSDCGAAFAPDEDAEAEAHHEEHWHEWLRAQCPIPRDDEHLRRLIVSNGYDHGLKIAGVRPWPIREEEDEEVPF